MTLDHAVALQAEGWRLQEQGHLASAAAALREALAVAHQCGEGAALDVANLLTDSAEIERERGAYVASLDMAQRALAVIDISGTEDLDDTVVRIRLRALDESAAARRALGHYADAEADLLRAIDLAVARFGRDSLDAAQVRNALGVVYKFWGRWDDGRRLYEDVLKIVLATCGEMSDAAATAYHNVGGLLHAAGDYPAAEAPARRAWDIARAIGGDEAPETMPHAVAYAGVLDGLGRHHESLAIYERAIEFFEHRYGPEHPEVAATLHNRAAARAAHGAHAAAERDYRRALAIFEHTVGAEAPNAALTRQNLGQLLCECGRPVEGVPLLRAALHALAARLPAEHPYVVAARTNLEAATR